MLIESLKNKCWESHQDSIEVRKGYTSSKISVRLENLLQIERKFTRKEEGWLKIMLMDLGST